tara:strand:+ start:384 stop:803 length:420 start_codon:yes stop_codon:yes gene_type:complete
MNILGLTDPVVQPTGALELADENSLNTTEFTNNVSELLIGLLLALVTGTLVSTGYLLEKRVSAATSFVVFGLPFLVVCLASFYFLVMARFSILEDLTLGIADHQTAIRYLEYSASTLYFAFSLSITLVASIYMQERRTE